MEFVPTIAWNSQTDYVQWSVDQIQRIDLGSRYQEGLAALIPGAIVKHTPKERGWKVTLNDRPPPVADLLNRSADWAQLIERFAEWVAHALEAPEHGAVLTNNGS